MYLENKNYEMENLFHNCFNYCWNNNWKNNSNNNPIMKNNVTYIWSDAVVDNIARKVAEEPMEDMFMPDSEEEFQADLAADEMRYHHYCLEQQEMYDDPYMNWSGLRGQ